MSVEKRKRCANFNSDEKMRFLRILQKKGNAILSKVTSHDLQTNRMKEEAWKNIANDLNSSGTVLRTTDNLKKLWQKLKSDAKTFKSIAYNEAHGTGGGPSKKMEDPVLELVAVITGRGSTGIEFVNDCDSDLLYTNFEDTSDYTQSQTRIDLWERNKTPPPPSTPPNIVIHIDNPDEVTSQSKESEEKELPTPKPHFKRRWPTLDSVNERTNLKSKRHNMSLNNNFASERLRNEKEKHSLIELQKQHMVEEHNIKYQHMSEEHFIKMKHGELKTKILETVFKKIQDDKSVDPDLLKIIDL